MNFGLSPLGAGGSGISIVRILGSLSKTVGIVRQFAPIYKDIKPLLKKAPILFEKINSLRNTTYNIKNYDYQDITNKTEENNNANGPTFFQ